MGLWPNVHQNYIKKKINYNKHERSSGWTNIHKLHALTRGRDHVFIKIIFFKWFYKINANDQVVDPQTYKLYVCGLTKHTYTSWLFPWQRPSRYSSIFTLKKWILSNKHKQSRDPKTHRIVRVNVFYSLVIGYGFSFPDFSLRHRQFARGEFVLVGPY